MKKILITITVILIGVLVGFYFYTISKNKEAQASLWDFVPPDAVIIYENKKPSFTPANAPDFAAGLRRALKRDSVFISPTNATEIIISLHIIGKEDFGVLFYLPDSAILASSAFKKLITAGKIRRRIFEDYTITEIPAAAGKSISYTTAGKNIIFSREAFLIEDVIRSRKEDGVNFKSHRKDLFSLMPADAGQGKIYANISNSAKFAGLFLSKEIKGNLFRNPVSAVITEARIDQNTLSLNGFALDSAEGQSSLLSIFNGQRPVNSEIQKIISNRSLLFAHYGIPDYPQWNKRRLAWSERLAPEIQKAFLRENRKNSLTSFYQCLGAEAGFCYLDATKGQKDDVFIIRVKPQSDEKLISLLSGDQQPSETYAGYSIHTLTSPEFIQTAFWPLNENNKFAYYTKHEPYFFFAENTEVLKGFINDIEEDNIWGKSAEWNEFFNATSLETNLSVEFNGALLQQWIGNKFASRWDSVLFPRPWGNPDKGAFQFSRLNYNYYFNGVLQFDPNKKRTRKTDGATVIPGIAFPDPISTIALVRNHNNNAPELIVQTAEKPLMLIASDLKIAFNRPFSDKIHSSVIQVDYYRNKKLQYAFVAGHRLYIIDRLGNDVKGFPVEIDSPSEPEFLTVLDYDNTKNYRFLITDQKGNLVMLDKEGKLLEGWDKHAIGMRLTSEPRLIRSDGKDYIISVGVTGMVQAFNRKGETVKGFPLTAGIHPQGGWFYEKGQEGLITVVSNDGIKIQINLQGKIVNRENYVRAAASSRFSLIVSPSADDFCISRTDKGKIAILNRKGEVLFEKENPGSEIMECGYFLPASGEKIFGFRDTQQDFTYLFNDQGQPVFNRPIESTKLPVMVRRKKEGLMVFAAFNAELKKYIP